MHIQSKLLWYTPVIGTHSSYQLGCLSTERLVVVVTLLEVSDREEGVVALYVPIGPLKTLLWSRYQDANPEPTSTFSDYLATVPLGSVMVVLSMPF